MVIRLVWDLPAEASHVSLCRRSARLLLESNDICDDEIDDVELILGEMCANVVRHAYPVAGGRYFVEFLLEDDHLCLHVSDKGRGFDRSHIGGEPRFSEAGGMGLFLMGRFADHIEFRAAVGGGSSVSAERVLHRKHDARPSFVPAEAVA